MRLKGRLTAENLQRRRVRRIVKLLWKVAPWAARRLPEERKGSGRAGVHWKAWMIRMVTWRR
jgi:hypothetical protein